MQAVTIDNPSGERLDVSFHEGDPGRTELVVVGHGVTGNKDRPFAKAIAGALDGTGLACLRLSFSGNGGSAGDFAASTVTKEVADLGAVLDAFPGWRIAYVGHSMGAAVGVLRAAADPRIDALVSLGGIVHTAAFVRRKFGDLTPGEDCMWDRPECPLSAAFVADMEGIGDVLDAASRVRCPWLLVHGTADDVVPVADSEAAVAAAAGARLVAVDGADHVFGDARHMAAMTEAVVPFLAEQLRGR